MHLIEDMRDTMKATPCRLLDNCDTDATLLMHLIVRCIHLASIDVKPEHSILLKETMIRSHSRRCRASLVVRENFY